MTTALELLTTRPDTPERSHRELALQIDLSAPLTATKGWAAPEVGAVYARARELCHQIGETTLLSRVLSGQTVFHLLRGELRTARELGEEVLSLSQHQQDPVTFLLAHLNLGATLYWRGEFALAQSYLEQATILFSKFQQPVVIFVADLRVASLSYIAGSLWFLGYPDQALKKLLEALTLAQELAHPFSLAYALQFAGWLHQFRREVQGAQERAEALIALCSEQGFPQWLAEGTIRRGWTLSEQGQIEEGLEQMQRGRATYEATGAGLSRPYYLASLAEVSDKAGQTGKGLTLLAEALAIVEQNGERMWEAEVYRLKGELSLQSEVRSPRSEVTNPQPLIPNPQTEAEACVHKAIEIAQRQQAKSLELRVVMSLSRLWQQQGKKKEAHTLLAEIYDWFTEGFDTKDLQEAKALLEALAA
ncbi:MAG: hypothetical protein HY268_21270 [Deltaproteobacteria bacterium]|nr:hypothetical protein [Deltaproteobacteria bacterium]